ncbi:MAG TPA: hypothetical protein P5243_09050 [Bacteroidales bacterium]|nr:hypothetical protein [Bacteroidales bacterium]HRS19640.1 hypothetical protein [Bacteroidales bacterium]
MNFDEQHIIKRVMHIFALYGVRSFSIDTIAMYIPLSKKELLKIAKNKEELIAKIFEYRAIIAIEISKQIHENPYIVNAIDILVHMSVLMSKACNEFNTQLDFEFKKYYPVLFAEYEKQKHAHIIQNMTAIIEQGQKELLFKSEIVVLQVAEHYFEQVQKHHESLQEESKFSRQTIEFMIEHISQFIQSISTQLGIIHFESKKHILFDLLSEWDSKV